MTTPPPDGLIRIEDDLAAMHAHGKGEVQPWKVLIVDDESEVHDATVFALNNLNVNGRELAFLHATSEADAHTQILSNPDLAVILLDVVMEAGDSGLRLVRHIRDDMKMDAVRIVLRTGQPGYAPELDVIQKYDINDYKTKLELTRTRLATTITAAIRSYKQIHDIRSLNASLELRVRERTRDLQRANRELESYSYYVAHDLRAPLRHILGFTDILQKTLGARIEGDDQRYLEKICRAATRMSQLIEDLLEFTRIGRASLKKVPLELNDIVAEVVHGLQGDIGARAISWHIGALPGVVADRSLIQQVLTNLISNAVKYSGKIAETRIEIGALPRDTAAQDTIFFVRDNGVGFDMKHAGKLFQPFNRLHSYEEFEGTGVGLSIVSTIIERHEGRIWAESKKGEGATFYFSLPA